MPIPTLRLLVSMFKMGVWLTLWNWKVLVRLVMAGLKISLGEVPARDMVEVPTEFVSKVISLEPSY